MPSIQERFHQHQLWNFSTLNVSFCQLNTIFNVDLLEVSVDLTLNNSFRKLIFQVHLDQVLNDFVEPETILSLQLIDRQVQFLQNLLPVAEVEPVFSLMNLEEAQVELPEGGVGDVALTLLVHFLPLLS